MNLLKLFIKYQLNGIKYQKQTMSACYSVSIAQRVFQHRIYIEEWNFEKLLTMVLGDFNTEHLRGGGELAKFLSHPGIICFKTF